MITEQPLLGLLNLELKTGIRTETNLHTNPRVQSNTTGWSQSSGGGTGGAQSASRITSAPTPPPTFTAAYKTTMTAGTYDWFGIAYTKTAPAGSYDVGAWVYASKAAVLRASFSASITASYKEVTLSGGTWQWVEFHGLTSALNATGYLRLYNVVPGSFASGDYFAATGLTVRAASTYPLVSFSGDTANTEDETFAWSGSVNASTSTKTVIFFEDWTPHVRNMTVNRGGQRKDASQSVDVGTLSCTLVNAGDPLTGSRIKPNVAVRLMDRGNGTETITVPNEVLYLQTGFPGGTLDGWTFFGSGSATISGGKLRASRTSGTAAWGIKKTFTGFIPGVNYALAASLYTDFSTTAGLQTTWAGVTGIGNGPIFDASPGVLGDEVIPFIEFTATSTTHEMTLTVAYSAGSTPINAFWDEIYLPQQQTVIPNPEFVTPGPVFTGRARGLRTEYELDKSTGSMDTFVTFSAVDAVSQHANTTRYGAVVEAGAGYETWAARIARLAGSSATPVELPTDDAPIVRYSL